MCGNTSGLSVAPRETLIITVKNQDISNNIPSVRYAVRYLGPVKTMSLRWWRNGIWLLSKYASQQEKK